MKYLLVFYFVGFFLADAALIKKYKLRLEPKEDEFQGTVTLTLSDSNNNHDVEINSYNYEVTECTYTGRTTGTTTEPPKEKPTAPPNEKSTETPTEKPTAPPNEKSTETPTEKPTQPPNEKSTETPTEKPTAPPNEKSTETPTEKPTAPPNEKSTETPTEKPTAPPNEKSTETPNEKPTQPPNEKSTETPTEKPTQPPNEKSTETPTEKPTQPPKEEPIEPPQKEQRCSLVGNKIKFPETRTSEEVVLKFKGKYQNSGLSKYETESKDRFYVANMAAENHRIIFPCQENVKAEFEFEGDDVVMSNLENLREKDDEKKKVFLRDLTFVQGDIVRDDKTIKSLPYYHMKTSKEMGQKLKNVMEKVAELDPSLKILFAPVSEDILIASRDVIILSGVDLKPDDSGSNYWPISHKLGEKLFQRPKGEKETFFDRVLPKFAAMKISGLTDYPFEGYRKFWQIQGLQIDGFNNSMSLNELASKPENSLEYPVLHAKGTSVLYSLESICGHENFTKGLSNYARNGNSKVNETFEGCFENKDKANQFFKVWTDDPGYPVVHVILNKTKQYEMDQERFLWFGSEQKDRRWIIPTDYKTEDGSGENILLPATKNKVTVTINSTYFILDHNNKGFYRVNYDAKLWEALISQLKSNHTAIDLVSRMKLIDDAFSFPKSTYNFSHGIPDYTTALKLSEYLRNETDFRALTVAFDSLGFLDWALNSSYHGKFRDHMKGILNGIYDKIAKVDSIIHYQVIPLACKFGVEKCLKNATDTFHKIELNTTELSDLQKLAICSVVRNDSAKWIDSFVLLSAMDIGSTEKNSLLGCSRDKKILSLFLSQFIRTKNKSEFEKAVAYAMEHNPDNIKVILDIIKRYEGPITEVFGKECLGKIVRFTLPKLNSESAATLKEIAKNLDEALQHDVNRACENVNLWTNTKAKSVGEYFEGSGSGSQAKPIALVLLATTLVPLANHIFHS